VLWHAPFIAKDLKEAPRVRRFAADMARRNRCGNFNPSPRQQAWLRSLVEARMNPIELIDG
jgi:hypothetical protein